MGGEEDGCTFVAQTEDGFLQQVGIDGIETAERLVEDENVRLVDNGGDELNLFLSHQLPISNLSNHSLSLF